MPNEKAGGYISRIKLNNGKSLEILQDDIVIFVGPNNSGKSQSLKDIYALSAENRPICSDKLSPHGSSSSLTSSATTYNPSPIFWIYSV